MGTANLLRGGRNRPPVFTHLPIEVEGDQGPLFRVVADYHVPNFNVMKSQFDKIFKAARRLNHVIGPVHHICRDRELSRQNPDLWGDNSKQWDTPTEHMIVETTSLFGTIKPTKNFMLTDGIVPPSLEIGYSRPRKRDARTLPRPYEQ
jgi:hypothetical protein